MITNTIKSSGNNNSKLISFSKFDFHVVLTKNIVEVFQDVPEGLDAVTKIIDENQDEIFTSAEMTKLDNSLLLIVGGETGIIKILNLSTGFFTGKLFGHGEAINQILVHVSKPNFIFSISSDLSVRAWDLTKNKTVFIFGGINGHRDIITCATISSTHLITGGHDNAIKIWKLPDFTKPYKCIDFPVFHATSVLRNVVSKLEYYGNLLVCKGRSNFITIIQPILKDKVFTNKHDTDFIVINTFDVDSVNLGDTFALYSNLLFIHTNIEDMIYVFDLNNLQEKLQCKKIRTNQNNLIISLSVNADYIYALFENGVLQRVRHNLF